MGLYALLSVCPFVCLGFWEIRCAPPQWYRTRRQLNQVVPHISPPIPACPPRPIRLRWALHWSRVIYVILPSKKRGNILSRATSLRAPSFRWREDISGGLMSVGLPRCTYTSLASPTTHDTITLGSRVGWVVTIWSLHLPTSYRMRLATGHHDLLRRCPLEAIYLLKIH